MRTITSTPDHSPIRVLCVDDHHLVRQCVVAVIEREHGLRVVAEARTASDAVKRFADEAPDVTLIGLRSRGLDSLETILGIRGVDPRAPIVVYARDATEAVYLALEAGAAGFVLEDSPSADFVRVITDVHDRNGALLDDIRRKLEARGGLPTLTTREIEVLELFTQGLRTKAISATLRISSHTVKVHMKSVYEKLGVQGRAAALAEALRHGFVRLPSVRHAPGVAGRGDGPRDRVALRANGLPKAMPLERFVTHP
jgi:DNA-binding NarL/FixJ family response regulator